MSKLEYFDVYTKKLGWEVIPIWTNAKFPFLQKWNEKYDREKMREYVEENQEFNLGLILGKIIDVEADRKADNLFLDRMIGDYPHPRWKSNKSIHHLFKNPNPNLTRQVIQGIEFRGYKHQSILPPSIVAGIEYKWIEFDSLDIPDMPKSLKRFYWRFNKKRNPFPKCWCSKCRKTFQINPAKFEKENLEFKKLDLKWHCEECKIHIA